MTYSINYALNKLQNRAFRYFSSNVLCYTPCLKKGCQLIICSWVSQI